MACGNSSQLERTTAPPMTRVQGRIDVSGESLRAGEVALLEGERVIASAAAAAEYTVDVPAGTHPTRLLVRLREPVAGAVVVALARDGATDVAIPASRVARLSGEVRVPAGITLAGARLALTPVLPDVTPLAMLLDGTGPATRAELVTHELIGPRFDLRVVRGTWRLSVERTTDGPLGSTPPDLTIERATVAGREIAAGDAFVVDSDVTVEVVMRAVHREGR